MSITRFFAFTYNNPTEEGELKLQEWAKSCNELYHIIYSKEKGSQEGTPHFQGALAFKADKKKTRSSVSNLVGIPEIHFEPCKKHYQANVNYCKKIKTEEEEMFKFIWQWPPNFYKLPKKGNATVNKKQTKTEVFELAKAGKFDEIDGGHWLT